MGNWLVNHWFSVLILVSVVSLPINQELSQSKKTSYLSIFLNFFKRKIVYGNYLAHEDQFSVKQYNLRPDKRTDPSDMQLFMWPHHRYLAFSLKKIAITDIWEFSSTLLLGILLLSLQPFYTAVIKISLKNRVFERKVNLDIILTWYSALEVL